MAKVAVEVNWPEYFCKIRNVCPWAYRASMDEKILVLEYDPKVLDTFISAFSASKFEALVVTCAGKSNKWLEQMCDKHNALQDTVEWLWSSPDQGGENSTPLPCLILQDADILEDLRCKTGYYEDAE